MKDLAVVKPLITIVMDKEGYGEMSSQVLFFSMVRRVIEVFNVLEKELH